MNDPDPLFRLDRSHFSVAKLEDQGNDKEYWASKTPQERLAALEFMRQVMYGYDPATERIQKIFTVTNLDNSDSYGSDNLGLAMEQEKKTNGNQNNT
jgi:hypothetical protein